MTLNFTEEEASALRELTTRSDSPSDLEISSITERPISDIRQLIQRLHKPLTDPGVSIPDLTKAINECKLRDIRLPPRIEPPIVPLEPPIHSANSLIIPPKFRGKQMAKTPTTSAHPQFAQFQSGPTVAAQSTQLLSIPILPRYASSPPAIASHREHHVPPKIGSLAAVLYPTLEHAHVCRVLGSCVQNDTECFLVAFFQSEHSPCYVFGEYLFQLQPNIGFPLGDEGEFRKAMESSDISVDWLLERIFSSAQSIVINSAEVLFPAEDLKESPVKPNGQQVQQIMFQCVSCAALLILCYIAGEWKIPEPKLTQMLSTVMRMSASKYETTRNIMGTAENLLHTLLLNKEKQ